VIYQYPDADLIEALAARVAKAEADRDRLRAALAVAVQALEIIVGERQCLDNLMGNRDVGFAALTAIRRTRKEPKT
jgi:hypothetical protein